MTYDIHRSVTCCQLAVLKGSMEVIASKARSILFHTLERKRENIATYCIILLRTINDDMMLELQF